MMRAASLLLALSAATAGAWPRAPARPLFAGEAKHPDVVLSLVLAHQQSVPPYQRQYLRFFWFGDTPDAALEERTTFFRVKLQTVNSYEDLALTVPVRGSEGRLWVVNYHDPRWTAKAVAAVFRRDFVFREPYVDHRLAEAVRREAGIAQDRETFHAEVVVPAEWFLRQIEKTEDSTAYYDLLYANERFGPDDVYGVVGSAASAPIPLPDPGPIPPMAKHTRWPGGVWTREQGGDGNFYPEGSLKPPTEAERQAALKAREQWREAKALFDKQKDELAKGVIAAKAPLPPGRVVAPKLIRDFPETLDDFEKRWGIADQRKFLDGLRLTGSNGEIVAGAKSDPKRGSYVAYQDRVIRFYQSPFGGASTSTQDFLRTAGRRNPFRFPKDAALGDLNEDLSEHLFSMPNGFQAALLAGARIKGRKRAEFGDSRAVHSSRDPADVTIYTQFSCVICHAPEDGLIAPSNRKIAEALAGRVELLERSKEDEKAVRAFFLEWEWKLGPWRAFYSRSLARASASPAHPSGWAGKDYAEATVTFRDWYDAPFRLDRVSARLGVSRLAVMLACLVEGSGDAANLFFDRGVPATVFDDDLAARLTNIIAAIRLGELYDPLFEVFAPELYGQALEKAKEGKVK